MGYDIWAERHPDAFQRFKELADKKKDVFDEDIVALVDDTIQHDSDRIRFVSLQVMAGSKGPQTAELTMEVDDKERKTKSTGDGPVDATFNAIKELTGYSARLNSTKCTR